MTPHNNYCVVRILVLTSKEVIFIFLASLQSYPHLLVQSYPHLLVQSYPHLLVITFTRIDTIIKGEKCI